MALPEAADGATQPGHPPAHPGGHDGEERRLGGSPQAVAANAALLGLSRAASSFTLYDPSNKVVRTLIADYRDKLGKVLAFGALPLAVHPFELLLGKDVVYLERDRERSLAFRLFRDGVRKITFEPATTWEEQLRLLEILSVRFTGVRQQEDDLVTLLRKASFEHVKIEAIEGFVPEEELAEAATTARRARKRYEPPAEWDLPLPAFREVAALRYAAVPVEYLEQLRAQESEQALPRAAVRAVAELLQALGAAELQTALAFAGEVRDFLLLERQAELLVQLGRTVAHALSSDAGRAREFLASYLDARVLAVVMASIDPANEAAVAPLLELLDAAPAEALERVVECAQGETGSARPGVLDGLVARLLRRSPELLARRIRDGRSSSPAADLRLLAEIDPAAALHTASEALAIREAAVQTEAVRLLAAAPFSPETARPLVRSLDSPFEDVRTLAYGALARGGIRVFPSLRAAAEKRAPVLPPQEAQALGRALVEASTRDALDLFAGWLTTRQGLLSRFTRIQAPPGLQWTALGGLRAVRGERAAELLDLLAARGESSVAEEAGASPGGQGRRG